MIDLPSTQQNLQQSCNQLATDCISRQAAIDLFPNDALEWDTKGGYIAPHLARRMIEQLPSAQPEPCLDLIVSEIEETIRETKENGKRHDINIRANGELICYGLQLALEIIKENRNERSDIQASGD